MEDFVETARQTIENIIHRRDKRILIVTGPCSIDNSDAALDYAERLKALSKKVESKFYLVMRTYFEKPRTTIGWKGMVYDPDLDKTFNIEKGMFPLDISLTDMERLCLIWRVNYCRNRDLAIVHYADEDTVFAVTKGGISPICILEKGAYKLPPEKAKELLAGDIPYLQAMGLSLISNYYVVSYIFKNRSYDEIWDKVNNRILSRFSNEGGKFGIPFRLPNGKRTWINTRYLYIDSNTVAFSIGADVASEGGVSGIDEDGNPVLVIMEL